MFKNNKQVSLLIVVIFVLAILFLLDPFLSRFFPRFIKSANLSSGELILEKAKKHIRAHLNYWKYKQFRGGWAQVYRFSDGKALNGEGQAAANTVILQHESTPRIGMFFLLAYEVLGDNSYLEAAKKAGELLLGLQSPCGGWAEEFQWDKEKWKVIAPKDYHDEGILDDGTTQNSIILLFWLYRITGDQRYDKGAKNGMQFLLDAQHQRGSWPQVYPGEKTNLSGSAQAYSILNDGAITFSAEILLWQSLREPSFKAGKEVFLRCADWLITVQKLSKIPAWGLQYDINDELTWARSWEPPAISPSASRDAMEILLTAYEFTSDNKYILAVEEALSWFNNHKENGGWVLFYDPVRGVPIKAKDGKIYDGAMQREGYVSAKPNDWGISAINSRYQSLKSGQKLSFRKPQEITDIQRKASDLFMAITENKKENEPFLERRGLFEYTHSKDRRPWKILELIEILQGNNPPKNILLRIDPKSCFPDVEHSKGR